MANWLPRDELLLRYLPGYKPSQGLVTQWDHVLGEDDF
jgi:hypothetical protein